MKVISQDTNHVLGAYVCPEGFVSQVVYFAAKPDLKWFNKTISDQVGTNFTTDDVRLATRHGWELGGDSQETLKAHLRSNPSITEVYWTRYARTEAQKQVAISLCLGDRTRPGCMKLFAHEISSVEKFCPACRKGRMG